MTIEREGSVYTKGSVFTIKCDICGDVIYMEKTDDFNDAIDRKKESGWKSTRYQGEWQDVCPKCQEGK